MPAPPMPAPALEPLSPPILASARAQPGRELSTLPPASGWSVRRDPANRQPPPAARKGLLFLEPSDTAPPGRPESTSCPPWGKLSCWGAVLSLA